MKYIPVTALWIALLAVLISCTPPATPTPFEPGVPSVGLVEKLQGGVEAGPETSLFPVEPRRDMHNDDAVRVFDNGKANLDFGFGLTFTLYNDTIGAGTRVDTNGTSHQAALKLSQGGLKGHNPPGSKTTVAIPNGVTILILGTQYFITYDPVEDEVLVYNFDGTLQYALPNGPYQTLSPRALVEIKSGRVTNLYEELPFTSNDFDGLATNMNSPIQGAKEMLKSIPVTGVETIIPTEPPTSIATPTSTATQTPTPTFTPTATVTQTPIPCYLARFVKDATIPDGTTLNPGTSFTKTWRLKNEGSCAWDSRYQLVFVNGTSMSEVKTFPWTGGTVGYGQSVDLSVNLIAPYDPGKYQGDFMILAPDGSYFGLGSTNKSFWVRIAVNVPNSPPAVPAIVSPPQSGILYCSYSNSLDWTIPYDDRGVVEYEVMLEKWPRSCSSWCSAFSASSVFVASDSLDVTNYLECNVNYRWRVRARDQDGAWSGWTNWTDFIVYSPVQ